VEEELNTNLAIESCQAGESADMGNSIVEAPLLHEKKPLVGLDMLRFKDSFFEASVVQSLASSNFISVMIYR